jgi:hypothetical protein
MRILLALSLAAIGATTAACSSTDGTDLGPLNMAPQDDSSPGADAAAGGNDAAESPTPDGATPGVDSSVPPSPDAASPADAGDDVAAAVDANPGVDSGLLGFGAACSSNAECASNLCFPFNAKGMHCTQPCASANDCPGGAGGLGCSGMNVCKVP